MSRGVSGSPWSVGDWNPPLWVRSLSRLRRTGNESICNGENRATDSASPKAIGTATSRPSRPGVGCPLRERGC